MQVKGFEDYLRNYHAKLYNGTDDDMADSFDAFLSELDAESFIRLADEWGASK